MLDPVQVQAEAATPSALAFSGLDWAVVGGVLLATSLFGAFFGRGATMREFFLGGRRLPWWAVSASIVATEISALTLVSLPAIVFLDGGTCAYLQITMIGSVVARFAIAWWLVPAYYEQEIYSPYDWVGKRLGEPVRRMMTLFGAVGGVLAQAARVYLTAVVLEILMGERLHAWEQASGIPSIALSIGLITAFAVAWTWIGGIVTVVWTDVLLFLVLSASSAAIIWWIVHGLDGGWSALVEFAGKSGRSRVLDFDASPVKAYTFWAALLAAGFGNIGAYGVDQLMAQRIFCCRGVREARLAVATSTVAVLVGLLVAWVGIALAAWYDAHPLQGEALALVTEKRDRILPVFVATTLPEGMRGFVVAGVFAAAISSLDAVLAALAQTVEHAWLGPWRERRAAALPPIKRPDAAARDRASLRASRWLVVWFGAVMALVAWAMDPISRSYSSLLDLGLSMAGYTQGALLAAFLLALMRPWTGGEGWLRAAPVSALFVYAVAWQGPAARATVLVASAAIVAWWWSGREAWAEERPRWRRATAALLATLASAWWLAGAGGFEIVPGPGRPAVLQPLAWPWYVPLGCAVATTLGVLMARRAPPARAGTT